MNKDRIIRLPEVMDRVGLKKTTIYRLMQEGTFPKQMKLGISSGWLESEIDAWINELVEARKC